MVERGGEMFGETYHEPTGNRMEFSGITEMFSMLFGLTVTRIYTTVKNNDLF